jgi:pimeloyl-ACP methyl ester carboxylesterase
MTAASVEPSVGPRRSGGPATAEVALWSYYDLSPRRRLVPIDDKAALGVLEVGSGRPVLFIHGTVGPGSWPSLISLMPGIRGVVLERPGWGASSPIQLPAATYRRAAADLQARVLDRMGIDRVTVVGASIGDVWALALAHHHPSRVERAVLLGGGPLVAEFQAPRFIRLLASPIGAAIVRLPMSAGRTRSILRDSGHGPALDAGRIPDEFIDWRVAVSNGTPAMRNERAMVRSLLHGGEWVPGLVFGPADLAAIEPPVVMIYGTADPAGDVAFWERLIASVPYGRLETVEGAGHMPWFDGPDVARRIARTIADDAAGSAGQVALVGSDVVHVGTDQPVVGGLLQRVGGPAGMARERERGREQVR